MEALCVAEKRTAGGEASLKLVLKNYIVMQRKLT
jgi:hypothetical protein